MIQDAGVEVPLDGGEIVDVPDVIAQSFIATGAARRLDDEPETEDDER